MKTLLGAYANGNSNVLLFSDGTKLRITNPDSKEVGLFESVDLKVTSKCKHNCPFCYEGSSPEGDQADPGAWSKLFDTMHPFTELAIGGGNPLEYFALERLLYKFNHLSLVSNITINYKDLFEKLDWLKKAKADKLLYGIGVSMPRLKDEWDDHLLDTIRELDAVMHVITGVTPVESIQKALYRNMKILFLGYKDVGRGFDYYYDNVRDIEFCEEELRRLIPKWVIEEAFDVMSFDNLAIESLNIKELFDSEHYNRIYMGDDGSHTMYIDLVGETFAKNSVTSLKYKLLRDYTAQDVWDIIQGRKKGIIVSL